MNLRISGLSLITESIYDVGESINKNIKFGEVRFVFLLWKALLAWFHIFVRGPSSGRASTLCHPAPP